MNDPTCHLVVEKGPDLGRRITVPAAGARIGRSSTNDIELTDPSLSRFHCRVFFKEDAALHVADLGSTNETLVNERPIVESLLRIGDTLEIGETVMRVVWERQALPGTPAEPVAPPAPPPAAAPVPPPSAPPAAVAKPSVIDLGLGHAGDSQVFPSMSSPRRISRRTLWLALVVLAVAAQFILFRKAFVRTPGEPGHTAGSTAPVFELSYEKVQGSQDNIFRYALELQRSRLTIRIDSLTENRHVAREKTVAPEVLGTLQQDLERTGFFTLEPNYQGLTPNTYDLWDLAVTAGPLYHRTRVLNRVQPEILQKACELIEEFARNELGLAAVALPPEKLLELSRDAVLQGQKWYAERDVRYENLSKSIRAFEEAQWYMESLEPKPEHQAAAVAGLEETRRALAEQFENYRFQADRAVKLRDWDEAARNLRIICELIPDRTDDRHIQASRKLLDVERRVSR